MLYTNVIERDGESKEVHTHKTLWSAAVYLNGFFREMDIKILNNKCNRMKLSDDWLHLCITCMCIFILYTYDF